MKKKQPTKQTKTKTKTKNNNNNNFNNVFDQLLVPSDKFYILI